MLPRGLTLDLVELLSGLPPTLIRRIGGVGGIEEARTRATDARIVLVLALLEDVVNLAVVVVELLAPLLSAPPELLGECFVFLSRVGASRPGNSEGEGAPVVEELPGGLVRQVVLTKIDVAGNLISPHVVVKICGAGELEVVLGTSDARVVLEVPP